MVRPEFGYFGVTLIGFGTFKAVDCAPRTGRNPSTGESIRIPGTKKPKFLKKNLQANLLNIRIAK